MNDYYQRRGLRNDSLRKYAAGIADLQRAAPFFHSPWEVYRQLADLYVLPGDDGRYQALWEQRQREMRQALAQLDSPGPHGLSQLADAGQLRAEINYGYLARAEYFIERRHQPTLAWPDLERAVATGGEEA